MRKLTAGVVSVVVFFAASGGSSVEAISAAECSVVGEINLSPGITMAPTKGRFYGTATLDCQGVAYGHTLAGPGFISYRGTYGIGPLADPQGGNTCLAGSGTATYESSVETIGGGTIHDTGSFVANAVGAFNLDIGSSHRGSIELGMIQSRSDTGDCLNTPVTHAIITGPSVIGGPA